jgi:arylsulfatase A-like enzyme
MLSENWLALKCRFSDRVVKRNIVEKTILFLTMCIALTACNSNEKKEAPEMRPNIVLIMADDIAPEHFSCYGGKIPTPNIDRLASQGMMFHRAYAPAAACTPSRFSIMTGMYPGRCNADTFTHSISEGEPYKIAWNTPIVDNDITIHEVLEDAGYFTAYVGKFHIGDLDFERKNTQMPEIDPDLDPENELTDSLLKVHQRIVAEKVKELTGTSFTSSIQWENPEELPIKAVRRHNLEWLTEGVASFFEKREKTEAFFLHINSTALHGPNHFSDLYADPRYTPEGILKDPYRYHPPRNTIFERLVEMGLDTGKNVADHIRHYNAGILYFDDQVGAIMEMIESEGLKDNTLIILTADHAIEPGKSTCYERGLRVPFIVSWPAKIEKGVHSYELVQFTDFLPTFADLTGQSEVPEADGISFLPALMQDSLKREYLYSEEGYTRSVTGKKYKYISMRFPSGVKERIMKGKAEIITHFGDQYQAHGLIASKYLPGYFDFDQLYDLENDPWEQNNLAHKSEYTEILDRHREILQDFTSTLPSVFPVYETDLPDTREYQELVNRTKEQGTEAIYWWKRELEYPPEIEVNYYRNNNP